MQPSNDNSGREIRSIATISCFVLLSFHFYFYCYQALRIWGYTYPIVDRFVIGLAHAGLFHHRAVSKAIALICLTASTIGVNSSAQPRSQFRRLFICCTGLLLYFGSDIILFGDGDPSLMASAYTATTLIGLIPLYSTAKALINLISWPASSDVFNRYNESFPQQERPVITPYSIQFKGRYTYRNQTRNNAISFPDPFRGTIVIGVPGSGKTRYIFRSAIQQSLAQGMALFVYDLKYDDLTRLTYNTLQREKEKYPVAPTFYSVNFDDFSRSHRCNPLHPANLQDISDAAECARTILIGLNPRAAHLQGEFFIESAIHFFTANIWFLRQYANGQFCTLAHLIELIQVDFYQLFSILQSFPDIQTLVGPFVSALGNHSREQLQGQVDSARIALSTLASPKLYYLLSANDFTLDINNSAAPKVVCFGSNPQKQNVYGAVISLYISQMLKLVNRKGTHPCAVYIDEFASLRILGMPVVLAQARSNKVAITIGIQDLSQLRASYGRDEADALFNLPGNLICGQSSGDSGRLVSERFGKILQQKSTVSTNTRDSSTSQTQQLDLAIPASKIATLSSGEFVGITADTPDHPIKLKAFHCRIQIDNEAVEKEESTWKPIPEVRTVTSEVVEFNFLSIKKDIQQLVATRLDYMAKTPALQHLIVKKGEGLSQGRSPN